MNIAAHTHDNVYKKMYANMGRNDKHEKQHQKEERTVNLEQTVTTLRKFRRRIAVGEKHSLTDSLTDE